MPFGWGEESASEEKESFKEKENFKEKEKKSHICVGAWGSGFPSWTRPLSLSLTKAARDPLYLAEGIRDQRVAYKTFGCRRDQRY